jgi:hypothetical protein
VKQQVEALSADPEFACFRDTPSVILAAAAGYPSDPAGYLRRRKAAKLKSRASKRRETP